MIRPWIIAPAARVEARDGFALVAALVALLLISALLSGGYMMALQDDRTGLSNSNATEAFYLADWGVQNVLGTWKRADYETVGRDQFDTVRVDTVRVNGAVIGTSTVEVRRVSELLYHIQGTGRVLRGGRGNAGVRRLSAMARPMAINVPADRAVQIYGGLKIAGTADVDGRDSYPTGWTDCDTIGTVAGVVAKDSSRVDIEGSAQVSGNPAVAQDTSLNVDDFLKYGDTTFDELKDMAEKVYAPGTTLTNTSPVLDANGECDDGVKDNWGAPTQPSHPCHSYFPIIYAQGNMTIASATWGQGVLLVEGDLAMSGGWDFYGVVIVKGMLKTTGTGAHITGSVMVHGGGEIDSQSMYAGSSIVNFSSCALKRATYFNSRAFPLAERGWTDLTGVGIN